VVSFGGISKEYIMAYFNVIGLSFVWEEKESHIVTGQLVPG
jgi:hypothetical protein